MKTGRSLSGTVSSPTGRPVAGATVVVHNRNNGRELPAPPDRRQRAVPHRAVHRPELGRIHDGGPGRWLRLGHASLWSTAGDPAAGRPALAAQAVAGPRGRFAGAADRGRDRHADHGDSATAGLDWEAETDADGRFVWFEAPATGTIMLDVVKPPFRQIVDRHGRRRVGRPHAHPAPPAAPARHGHRRRDRPADRAVHPDLRPGPAPCPAGPPQWDRDKARSFTDGRFDLTGGSSIDQGARRSIRIEADGYEPAEFLGFHDNVEDVAHDFRLRRRPQGDCADRGSSAAPTAGRWPASMCSWAIVTTATAPERTAGDAGPVRVASRPDRPRGPICFPPRDIASGSSPSTTPASRCDRPPSWPPRPKSPWRPGAGSRGSCGSARSRRRGRGSRPYLLDRRFPGSVGYDTQTDRDRPVRLRAGGPGPADRLSPRPPGRRAGRRRHRDHVDVKPGRDGAAPARRHGPAGRRPARPPGGRRDEPLRQRLRPSPERASGAADSRPTRLP